MAVTNSSAEANIFWPGFRAARRSLTAATSYWRSLRQSSRASGLPSPALLAVGVMPASWRSFSLPGSARRREFNALLSSRPGSGCGKLLPLACATAWLACTWANGLPPLDFTPCICCICRTITSAMPMPWPSRDSDTDSCWSYMS
ncbi:hypothetical protein D9M71_583970 [compost metagenome]